MLNGFRISEYGLVLHRNTAHGFIRGIAFTSTCCCNRFNGFNPQRTRRRRREDAICPPELQRKRKNAKRTFRRSNVPPHIRIYAYTHIRKFHLGLNQASLFRNLFIRLWGQVPRNVAMCNPARSGRKQRPTYERV